MLTSTFKQKVVLYSPWFLLAIIMLAQFYSLPGHYLGQEHDDAQYVLSARNLFRGEYRLGISPGNPVLTYITPGYPILLMPAAWLSGENHLGYHLYAWLWLAICDVLVFLWLRKRLSLLGALICTAIFGLNPLVLARSGTVMTEIPGLALTLLLFLLIEMPQWRAWGSGAILGYIWLIRQGTVALFPAVCGWYLWGNKKPRWKNAAIAAGIPLGVMLLWSVWLSQHGTRMSEVDELSSAYASDLGQVPRVAISNIVYYARLWGGTWTAPGQSSGIVALMVGLLLTMLSAAGGVRIFRSRRWDPALAWLGFGAAMHIFWPWQYERYLTHFLPVVIWTSWEGLAALERALAGSKVPDQPSDNYWVTGLVCLVLGCQFWTQSRFLLKAHSGRFMPEYQETYAWIRSHIPPNRALASAIYARDALYTGHAMISLPDPAPPEILAKMLKNNGVCCVLLSSPEGFGSSLGRRFAPAQALAKLRVILSKPPFRIIYANPVEGTVIFGVADAL